MKFRCSNCGCKLHVPDARAGKMGRCPKCRNVVTVPDLPAQETADKTHASEDTRAGRRSSLHDPQLLDVPEAAQPASPPAPQPQSAEEAYARLQALHGGRLIKDEPEVPQRTLPWFLDIFLYPLNKSGLCILLISTGIPFLLRAVVKFFFFSMAKMPSLFIFWVLSIMVHWSALALLMLYMNWYVCECIRDSAVGGIRAADTTASTPGFGAIFAQMFKVLGTVAVCMAPALIYMRHAGSADELFWTLYGMGGFLLPMALLAVVMFDTFRGLNPLLLIGSILSTFVRYCALVMFSYLLLLLIPPAASLLRSVWVLGYVFLLVAFYLLLVLAHLLGRFYWRTEEKLNWEV